MTFCDDETLTLHNVCTKVTDETVPLHNLCTKLTDETCITQCVY